MNLALKKESGEYQCESDNQSFASQDEARKHQNSTGHSVENRTTGRALHLEEEDEVKKLEEEISKTEEDYKSRELERQTQAFDVDTALRQYRNTPNKKESDEKEVLKEASAFLETLKATIDTVTLMAKDQGWLSTSGVSDKVSPTTPTQVGKDITGENVAVALKKSEMPVQINWFNTVMAELKDIVSDANKFFEDAGWNSKEVVKEYNEHKKHWGKDYTAGT
jgi:hypothetical protein